MQCKRCGHEFDRDDLRPPSTLLRLLAAPFFVFLMFKSALVRGEFNALYCRPCRRQLNACFLFIAFMVIVALVFWGVQ
jgi:hypothetical protein